MANGLADLLLSVAHPEQLIVEITENEQIKDDHRFLATVAMLRREGIAIAVDDLGTCYAGLELLLLLRPDIIKVDRFIVQTMSSDPAHRAVAAGITTTAREIGSEIVAEGIETAADLDAVRGAGIHWGQGYLLGRPTPDIPAASHPVQPPQVEAVLAAG